MYLFVFSIYMFFSLISLPDNIQVFILIFRHETLRTVDSQLSGLLGGATLSAQVNFPPK